MKHIAKILSLLLILCLLFSGCGDTPDTTTQTTSSQTSQTTLPPQTDPPEATLPPQTDPPEATLPPQTDPPETTLPPQTDPPETTLPPQTDPPKPTVPPQTQPSVSTPPSITEPEPEGSFRIDFIDVGQADAALIRCDGRSMLIDGGNAPDSNLIYTYLKKQGVDHLDYIVCTHAHEDHVGGLSGALQYATVTTAFSPVTSYSSKAFNNFKSGLSKQNVSITIPDHGNTFSLGSAQCQVVGPINPSDDPNNTSIVLHITYGQTSFLFTGDAETDEENDILEAGYNIDCDVLKVGHHGSSSSTSYRWLRETSPEYAVISVGTDNSYGHPTQTVLSRLRDADVTVYRTDLQGDIICTSDGTSVTFTTGRNQNTDTLEGAGAGGSHGSGEKDYTLNTKTMIFHDPNCEYAKKMSPKNRKDVNCTRDELIDDGYSPCGACKP